MSAISDGVTIIGDGSNSTTLVLATASVADVATMQSYNGPATVMQVADAYQGGTFNYVQAEAFISGSLVFNGATITLPSAQTPSFLAQVKRSASAAHQALIMTAPMYQPRLMAQR